jgi:ClpX C4-type zinc finger protein
VIGSGEPVSTRVAELAAGPEQQPRAQCSFCGKHRDQVPGLVVSSAQTGRKTPAAICTECLALCTEILIEEQQAAT